MAWGLPKLPGLTFADPTKTQHHMCSSLKFYQGYRFPDTQVRGPGGAPTDVDSNAFALPEDPVVYDPSLTYGRVKQTALPQVIPNWVHYDKRCLNFKAFMKQPVYDNPDEHYRLRIVNIIYFLEDDTMTVTEPAVKNSGIWQGRMVTRGRIPKNDQGAFWHWKDLNVAKDICIYGKVFHTVSCDLFTKEWLESQGIELQQEEDLPTDPYTKKQRWNMIPPPQKPKADTDTFRRFLEYDGKVLAFEVAWDTRDEEYGELTPYRMYYFLQDDTIAVKELHDERGGKDPFPLLLKKTKLPKKWKERPADFPSSVMETTDEEVTQYYSPIDLIVGTTVFVLGRRMLIYDCDLFTRKYYKAMLNIDQPPRIEIKHETKKEFKRTFPPHIGIGTPEDSIQSCYSLIPKAPHKDIIKYNLNARKYLRYLCELEWIHPEDKGREFVLSYSLADGTIKIGEIAKRNSGIKGGQFLKPMLLETPDSDPNFPTYMTPERFYIGAIVPVFKHRFKITGCDLFVYRYMSANPEKFPPEVIDNVRNYHMREGNLKDELKEASREEQAQENRAQMLQIGVEAVDKPNAMQQCLTALNVTEASSEPGRPRSPPPTTEHLSYEDSLRIDRQNKPTCDGMVPLKGILKSGAARDDHQKTVCFTGPATGDHREGDKPQPVYYPPGQQPHYDDDPDFCERYKDPGADVRTANRAKDICQYEVTPKGDGGTFDDERPEFKLPGYLGTYGVDCKEVADYMRLAPDAYEKVKAIRKEVPEISPAAARVADLPRDQFPALDTCTKPPPTNADPCEARKELDVTFACPHVTPKMPCCVPKPC